MYVSVPKNYSGTAFPVGTARGDKVAKESPSPLRSPAAKVGAKAASFAAHSPSPLQSGVHHRYSVPQYVPPFAAREESAPDVAALSGNVAASGQNEFENADTGGGRKNPLEWIFSAIGKSLGAEELLLLGLIGLLYGKENTADIVLILTLLLLS